MTLLQRLQDVPTVIQIDPDGEPFVPIRPETRDAVVDLVKAASAACRGTAGDGAIQVLSAAVAVFTEDKP